MCLLIFRSLVFSYVVIFSFKGGKRGFRWWLVRGFFILNYR